MSTSTVAQQKFTNLRRRLDQLGYRQPLAIESLPLVEKLFADLLHTTESLKNTKLQLNRVPTPESRGVESLIEPYKSDNAKLVKENNDLHRQLLKLKEDSDFSMKDMKSTLRKLEHENADLKFLNNQYVHKVRSTERESADKTDKILQLQEKNFHAVVQTPGGHKKSIPFRRQRMELDSTVPPAPVSSPVVTTQAEDPFMVDLLKVADGRIADLQRQLDKTVTAKDIAEGKVKNFRKQVESRDREVDRLSGMLEGGRPYDVVALEARNRSNERMISHLNIQIDYLQQQNRDLQRQVSESKAVEAAARTEKVDLDLENRTLQAELRDVDHMASQLHENKETVIRTADRDITDAKLELEKSRQELLDMDVEIAQLRTDRQNLTSENGDLRSRLSAKEVDVQRLEDLLDKVQEDKRRLGQRVNKLTSNERELVLEIDRLKRKAGLKKSGKSVNHLDAFIKGIEEERDYWKGEVDTLQKMLQMRSDATATRGRSPVRSRASSPVRDRSPGGKSTAQYETIMRVLEDERDYYKREYELLRTLRHSRTSSPSRSPPTRDRSLVDDGEVARLQRERDELQSLLDKFERHMSEIQANVKVLTTERDKINLMYEQTKEELQRMRREIVKSPKSAKISLAAQAVLRRVENERDDGLADLRRMTTERDSLRERLKIATENSLSDRARLEQRIEDLEIMLNNVETERNELHARCNGLKEMVDTFEDQVKEQAIQINETMDEASQQKATSTQMRLLAEQTERSLDDNQRRLTRKEGELRASEERCSRLEERVADLQRVDVINQEEITKLRTMLGSLDREKDSLQMTVDEKTERIANQEDARIVKEKHISDLKLNISELEVQLENANSRIDECQREIKSLRRQLDGTTEELTETIRGREVALRENRRQQDDLGTLTRENQNLHQDLGDTMDDRERLREQIQDYILEVKRMEELLAAKEAERADSLERYRQGNLSASSQEEQERSDLLEQYRSLSRDTERFETQTHHLESEGSNLRLEIMAKDSELRRLRDQCELQEREIQEHLHAQKAYEMQVSNLTRSIANLEENLRLTENEKLSAQQDVAAVRDLCTRLETTKDSLQRQVTQGSLELEQLQNVIDDSKHELDVVRGQVNSERTSVKNLEGLLHSNREKEFQIQLTTQEKSAELQLMKDRLTLNESKLQSVNREVATLRNRNMELESEIDRIRRQLTSERFERERASQELRRHGLTPPTDTSGRLSRATPTYRRSSSPGRRPYSPTRSILKSPNRSGSRSRSRIDEDEAPQNRSLLGWIEDTDKAVSSITAVPP